MAAFAYRGRGTGGQAVEGVLEAVDATAAATQLMAGGITPVSIRVEDATPAKRTAPFGDVLARRRVQTPDLMLLCRQMHALLKAGVPIMRALGGLQESATNPALREALRGVREGLDGGRDLSASMQRQRGAFDPFFVAMVYVGESTGRLEEVFLRLFRHLEFQDYMRAQVKSALRYPTFVVVAMAAAIGVINLFVIPAFARVYKGFGADLPLVTRLLIACSDFTLAAWPYLLAVVVAAAFAARGFVQTSQGRLYWDRLRLRLPIAGKIASKAAIARFSRSFSLAYRSGVPITQALTLSAQTVDNAYVGLRVEKMREGVERGESLLRTAVNAGVFTPVALQMIVVGEESGSLDEMMEEVAELYQRDVEYELKTLSAQIEPILIVGLGILVLILALGVFLPIWDLGQAAFHKG
ncbi:MAG: type II secretion system F family protein [Betaproteobacteria bacterium]|nr:type II secretion system F family protein [Betaproteobacteria bacterium]